MARVDTTSWGLLTSGRDSLPKIINNFNILQDEIDNLPTSGGGSSYSLPTASASVLGGVRIGSGLEITNGLLSATSTGGSGGGTVTITGSGGLLSVKDSAYGAVGNGSTNDSIAFTACISAAASAGMNVWVPPGTYVVNNVALLSGIEIFGDRSTTILIQPTSTSSWDSIFQVNKAYSSPVAVKNVRLHNMQLKGRVDTQGFSEFISLLLLGNVSNIEIDHCDFIGFRGDAIDLIGFNSMHNEWVSVHDCLFDGVNHDNRQCLSVEDGNHIFFLRNVCQNCTRPDMPGAVDVETNDDAFAIVKDIWVCNNYFKSIGGNACMVVSLQNSIVNYGGFHFEGNTMESLINNCGAFCFSHYHTTPITVQSTRHDITVSKNKCKNQIGTSYLVSVDGIHGAKFSQNTFSDCAASMIMTTYENIKNIDITWNDNTFERITDGSLFYMMSNDDFNFYDNKVINCPGYIFTIGLANIASSSSYLNIHDNRFLAPNVTATDVFSIQSNHTFSVSTNTYFHNKVSFATPGQSTWIAKFGTNG